MKNLMLLIVIVVMLYFTVFKQQKTCENIEDASALREQLNAEVRRIISSQDLERAFALQALQDERNQIDQTFSDYYSGKNTQVDFLVFCQLMQSHMDKL